MKKALAFLVSVALLVAPAGCAAEPGQLTLERVEQLAEKGEALTWSDFEGYAYEEAGSGLYIRVYDVNEEYYVMVGGPSLEESPLYVRLVSRDDGERAREVMEANREAIGCKSVELNDQIAKISIVGAGMAHNAGVACKMFEALFSAGININMISTSEIKVSVLVDERDADRAVQAVHDKFFSEFGGNN